MLSGESDYSVIPFPYKSFTALAILRNNLDTLEWSKFCRSC